MQFFFWAIIILILLLEAITYVLWAIVFRSPNKKQNDDHNIGDSKQITELTSDIHHYIDKLNAIPYEIVETSSMDGLKLRGRLYISSIDAPFILCCHGYRGTPSRDFSAGSAVFMKSGFNLLLIEQRAHKSSEGHAITMGCKERFDCLKWIDYIISRFGESVQIVLCGISMGASTVLLTSDMDIPANVKGIIADSPYTSPYDIISDILKRMKLPVKLFISLLNIGTWLFDGPKLNTTEGNVLQSVERSKLPILLIHGDQDNFVPYDMSCRIYNSNQKMITFYVIEGAGHGLSCICKPDFYEKAVIQFLKSKCHVI